MIGEVDFSSALTTVHPKAIYLHQGQQYHVEALDFDERKAYVKRVDVDYYTDAIRYTQVRVLECRSQRSRLTHGRRRRAGRAISRRRAGALAGGRLQENKIFHERKCRRRESLNCRKTKCTPRLSGSRWSARWWNRFPFRVSDRQSGMFGLLHALESIATLLLMCDARDLGTAIGERPPPPARRSSGKKPPDPEAIAALAEKEFFEPNLYLYDAYPGGIGFSEPLYRAHICCSRKRAN